VQALHELVEDRYRKLGLQCQGVEVTEINIESVSAILFAYEEYHGRGVMAVPNQPL
jgi:hypothetical protein